MPEPAHANANRPGKVAAHDVFRWMTILAFAACALLWSNPARAVLDTALYDGEPGGAPLPSASCLEYASETTAESYSGLQSLILEPSPWHTPKLILYCGGAERRNLSGYDVIDFYTRAADP